MIDFDAWVNDPNTGPDAIVCQDRFGVALTVRQLKQRVAEAATPGIHMSRTHRMDADAEA